MSLPEKVRSAAISAMDQMEAKGVLSEIYYIANKGELEPVSDEYKEDSKRIKLRAAKEKPSAYNVANSMAQVNDIFFTVIGSELGFKPEVGARIEHDGKCYSVINSEYDSLGIVFLLQVRS